MANQNLISLVLSSFLASFVIYKCCARKKDIIEPFGATSVPSTVLVDKIKDGNSVCGGTQEEMRFNTTNITNPHFFTDSAIDEGIKELKNFQKSNDQSSEGYCGGCNNSGSQSSSSGNSAPFYTVNGTKDPYLSPRFDSEGVASKVRYNLPETKHLANVADDPFTIANYVDKPKTHEGYHHGGSNKQHKSSKDVGGVDLPVDQTMSNNGAPKQQESRDGFVINGDRLMFSTSKSFSQSQGCPIRGDLPVIPILPQCDRNSLVSFRPAASSSPQSALKTGAMNVIGGIGNTTAMQLQNLKSNATGGTVNITGGVPIIPDPNTIGGQSYNMANNIVSQSQSGGIGGPPGTVINTVNPSNAMLPM